MAQAEKSGTFSRVDLTIDDFGEFHVIVNLDRNEYLDPSVFGDSSEFHGLFGGRFGGVAAMAMLLKTSRPGADDQVVGRWIGDRVMVLGEYSDPELFENTIVSGNDISLDVFRVMAADPDMRAHLRERMAVRRKLWATPEHEAVYAEVLDND